MTWFTHKSPLVKTIQTDYQRYGACAVLSLETAKNMMIENGYDQYLNEKDSDFTAVIYLKVRFFYQLGEKSMKFSRKKYWELKFF